MSAKKKPEPPLIDEHHGRFVEQPGPKETPIEDDVEQAEDVLDDDAGEDQDDGAR